MRRYTAEEIDAIFERIEREGLAPIWISLADRAAAVERARTIDPSLPLAGVPFAVKDNIDVAGMPTTAACPSFAYVAGSHATVVARLLDAGAILIGKTNMDQFATGLVGVRSPYGVCSNVFDERYISGGSSSGSAVAVAKGLVSFALGTDTAGSGRVPAAFNDLVGIKPTRGLVSTAGVVPACRSLDCVSIFAASVADAARVLQIAQGADAADPYSRTPASPSASAWDADAFRFGVPRDEDLEFFGDDDAPALYAEAVARLRAAGGTPVTIDFRPFRSAAALLYSGPWVAERYAAVGGFIERAAAGAVHPVVADIILGGKRFSAADAFEAAYQLEALKAAASPIWKAIDVMLLPTAGTIYTKANVDADPVRLNSNLGYYTNFVNLMDLAAVAIPAGFRPNRLPFGVSLIGPAFSDTALLALAGRFAGEAPVLPAASPLVRVAVVGAHLTGQPLNHQLTGRGARRIVSCRSDGSYRLYALANTTPPKPGLVRDPGYRGDGIALEVWAMPAHEFGGFVAAVPPPLAIGSVQLETGEWVKGFVCEPAGLEGAEEITQFGGWVNFLNVQARV